MAGENTTSFAYDDAGELVQVTNGAGRWRRFAYDARGRQVTVTDARGTATKTCDDASRLVRMDLPTGRGLRRPANSRAGHHHPPGLARPRRPVGALRKWIHQADVDDGCKEGLTTEGIAEGSSSGGGFASSMRRGTGGSIPPCWP